MDKGEISSVHRLTIAGRTVRWNGWTIHFKWDEGFIATKDGVTVSDYDTVAGLSVKLFEHDTKESDTND